MSAENYEHQEWADFRDEIKKVQRGVKFMWLFNFIFLSLVFNAIMVVALMNTYATTAEILNFLLWTTLISLVAAAITLLIVVRNSRKFIASGLGSSTTEVYDGPLFDAVEEASISAGMSTTPRVFISNDNVMNAYALGDNKGNHYVAATQPLLNALNRDELTAVMAHEVAHINSGDSVAMQKLIALSSMIGLVSSIGMRLMFYGGMGRGRGGSGGGKQNPIAIAIVIIAMVFLVLAPIFSQIGNAFMSRQRETRADRLAVQYTRDPTALATALMKINGATSKAVNNNHKIKEEIKKFNNTVGAVAFYKPNFIGRSFATHPPFEQRVKDLQAMGAQVELPELED